MTTFRYANFVDTELEEGISAGATEIIIPVAASEALPELDVDEEIRLVLWDGQQDPEIISATANPQNGVLTVVRGVEDTTPKAWEAGTQVKCVLTAEIINTALEAFFDLEAVLQESFLPLTGGTVTGPITLPGAPTSGLHAATKSYVDGLGSNALPVTGGTMSGNINMGNNQVIGMASPTIASSATRKDYVDNLISGVQGQISAGAAVHDTTGTASAYVVTTGQSLSVLSDGMAFIIRPHTENSDDPTLAIDSTGAKPILVGTAGIFEDLLVANTPYTVVYDEDEDAWILANITNVSTLAAPSGTRLLFQQTTPPPGWTKDVSHNNTAVRIVSGTVSTGGTANLTDVFKQWSILQANLPSVGFVLSGTAANHVHTGTFTGATDTHGGHAHSYNRPTSDIIRPGGSGAAVWAASLSGTNTGSAGSHNHSVVVSGTVNASGSLGLSGVALSGGSGTPLDFRAKYVDFTIGEKD